MANVLAQLPQFGFNHSHSPNHPPFPVAPSPAIMAGWAHVVHQPSINYQLPATRVQKRRLEPEDEDVEARLDVVMERTPTPERPKRAPPKRARRGDTSTSDGPQNNQDSKNGRSSDNEVDIGVLLGTFISTLFSRPSLTKCMRSHTPPPIATSNSHCVNQFPAFSQVYSPQSDTPTDCGKCGTGPRSVGKEIEGRLPIFQHLLFLCHPFVVLFPWHLTKYTFQHFWCHAYFCRLRSRDSFWHHTLIHQPWRQWNAR